RRIVVLLYPSEAEVAHQGRAEDVSFAHHCLRIRPASGRRIVGLVRDGDHGIVVWRVLAETEEGPVLVAEILVEAAEILPVIVLRGRRDDVIVRARGQVRFGKEFDDPRGYRVNAI